MSDMRNKDFEGIAARYAQCIYEMYGGEVPEYYKRQSELRKIVESAPEEMPEEPEEAERE